MKNILAFRTNKDWDKLQNNTIIDKGHWGRNCKRRSLVHLLLLSKESIKNQHWFASGMDQCKHYKILHLLSDSILWKVQFGIHYMVVTRKIIRQVVGWLVSGIVLQYSIIIYSSVIPCSTFLYNTRFSVLQCYKIIQNSTLLYYYNSVQFSVFLYSAEYTVSASQYM